jgi:membrane-associated protease RseP (regulator of RpoE activity)
VPEWQAPPRRPPRRAGVTVHIVLFVLTFVTTSFAGALTAGVNPLDDWTGIRAGFPFSVTLLTILLCHEMGHYFLARYHDVEASLPYFIPAPPFFLAGTFGAFIRMRSSPPSRKALFDVGAAGPWAGVLVAIPALIIGLLMSDVRPAGLIEEEYLSLGEPLLFSALSYVTLGPIPEGMDVFLHPVALAGWIGLLVTFLNLLPVGQLDGGHVAYAFIGRWHRLVARGFFAVVAILALTGWPGWLLWVVLLLIVGLDHPPTLDNWTPLDLRRQVASCLTGVLFVLTFMAEPLRFAQPSPVFEGEKTAVSWTPPVASHSGHRLIPMRSKPQPKGIPL